MTNIFGTRQTIESPSAQKVLEENRQKTRRRIFLNTPSHSPIEPYPPNRVQTSKYTLLTFFPKNIIEQFRGIANFYFLSLVILQAFSIFATVPVIVAALPIIIIVMATMFKVYIMNNFNSVVGWCRRLEETSSRCNG